MRLVRQTRLHFREKNSDKIYEVDLCELNGAYLVNFRYGRRGAGLTEGTKTTNPVSQAEAEKIFQKLVDEKARKGYQILAEGETEAQAKPKTPKVFDAAARQTYIVERLREAAEGSKKKYNWQLERVIWRAGKLKIKEAAPFVVKLIGTGNALRDYCCVWALGFCGDETSVAALVELQNNPNTGEATRRITSEAILKISNEQMQRELQAQAIKLFPADLSALAENGTSKDFERALRTHIEATKRGSHAILTQIYAVNNEIVRPVLLKMLGEVPLQRNFFKPLRHIFKIAEYRCDAEVFGIIARRFEIEKANFTYYSDWDWRQDEKGRWQQVKRTNGLDSEDSAYAFGAKTKNYLVRRTWRSLRKMGEDADSDFVKMAVGSLLPFTDADAQEPRVSTRYDYRDENGRYDWRNPKVITTSYDTFAPYLLFNHLLYENSSRYELKNGSRAFSCRADYKPGDATPAAREEAFPALWDRQPAALLHLLSESSCLPVHEFAVKALQSLPEFLDTLDLSAILMLLERPYEITAKLGFELARARYDARNPNLELVLAVAVCRNAEARATARNWIQANPNLFARNNQALLRLLTSNFADVRDFAAALLQTTVYSNDEAQALIGQLISELISFDETRDETARDLSRTILDKFGKELQKLNLDVVLDLLAHPLEAVQELGGNVLLDHETKVENLPSEIINSLIASQFETMRGIGIKLFAQLPDENLRSRENVIFALLEHELADVSVAARPIVRRLSEKYSDFAERLTNKIVFTLLQTEKHEGVAARLLETLRTDVSRWTDFVELDLARTLLKNKSLAAQETGGIAFLANAEKWHEQISTEEIIELTNAEALAVRQASWELASQSAKRFRANSNSYFLSEVTLLVRALDAKWDDSRNFWFGFFRDRLTAEELSPQILVAICDSVREPVNKFGRDLLLKYFREENGAEYLLKLSEHPSPNMQLFATNYLESYASNSPERIRELRNYFVRVLSLVNRARTAKNRILGFLEREAMKNQETALIVAEILARQSATMAIGDKAATIEAMLKIRQKYPEIALPIVVKETEVRSYVG